MFQVLICCSSRSSCSSLHPFSLSISVLQSAGWREHRGGGQSGHPPVSGTSRVTHSLATLGRSKAWARLPLQWESSLICFCQPSWSLVSTRCAWKEGRHEGLLHLHTDENMTLRCDRVLINRPSCQIKSPECWMIVVCFTKCFSGVPILHATTTVITTSEYDNDFFFSEITPKGYDHVKQTAVQNISQHPKKHLL